MRKILTTLLILITVILMSACKANTLTTQSSENPSNLENPIVTNGDEIILDFEGLKVSKQDLYNRLLRFYGMRSLLIHVDKILLADYTSKVNMNELRIQMYNDKQGMGETQFYDYMIRSGYITSLDDPNKDTLIEQKFYFPHFLQLTYGREVLGKTTVSTSEVTTELAKLREAKGFKIYDQSLSKIYKSLNPQYNPTTVLLDDYTLAQYMDKDGKVIKITTDDLYQQMKKEFAAQMLIEMIYVEALKTKTEIALTTTEFNTYIDEVNSIKEQFSSMGYDEYMTWEEYLLKYYRAFSEAELANRLSLNILVKRYILGHGDFAGTYPITQAEIDEAYNNWFSINASHIYFKFDLSDPLSQEVARVKATQVINGCTTLEIDTNTCYINYENAPFVGLKNIDSSLYGTVFSKLARTYSEDGAKTNGGNLGYFGPGQMVPEFEEATKEIASRGNNQFSLEPLQSQVPSQTGILHGYHVIYVVNIKEKPVKPANYDEINDPSTSTDTAVKTYYNLMSNIEGKLSQTHLSPQIVEKHLADLIRGLEISINDEIIQAHVEVILSINDN